MRFRSLFLAGLLLILVTAACTGPPPTLYVLVVTATPEFTEPTATDAASATSTPQPSPQATVNTPAPLETISATSSAQLTGLPTPTVTQILIAEQIFQKGRMYWLQPTNQIWVMINGTDGAGVWRVYQDTFVEGEPEFDPDITPPQGLIQPERGFGKLWRNNQEVRDAVGWALEPELGHVTNYEYQPEGEMVDGTFEMGPGYHLLTSFYGDVFRFNEVNATWQTIPQDE